MSNNKTDSTLADILKIFEIAEKFHNSKDHKEGHILDRFFILNPTINNAYGNIIIGARGFEILNDIATRHTPPNLKNKISASHLSDLFRQNIFSSFVIRGLEINKKNTQSIIDNSVNALSKKESIMIHFIPFNFFSNFTGSKFTYGELTIHSMSEFEFANEIQSNGESCHNYYSQFNAIAEISISGIDHDVTLYKAKRILDSFLGICRLIPGASSLPLTTRPNASHNTLTFALSSSNRNELNFTKNMRFVSLKLENWNHILLEKKDTFFDIMKVILSKNIDSNCNNLANRVIDGLITFQNALDENDVHFRLVRLISVVERLYSTKTTDEVTWVCSHCKTEHKTKSYKINERIKQRGMDLLKILDCNLVGTMKKLETYYGLRSNIVHGHLSLIADDLPQGTSELEEIVGNLIIASAFLYYKNGIFELTDDNSLDDLFIKLKEHHKKNNFIAPH